jgi:hypothetical protein
MGFIPVLLLCLLGLFDARPFKPVRQPVNLTKPETGFLWDTLRLGVCRFPIPGRFFTLHLGVEHHGHALVAIQGRSH